MPNLSALVSLGSASSEDANDPRRGGARGRNFAFALTFLAILAFVFVVMVTALIALLVLNWPPDAHERGGKQLGTPSASAAQGHLLERNRHSSTSAMPFDAFADGALIIQGDLETGPGRSSMEIAMASQSSGLRLHGGIGLSSLDDSPSSNPLSLSTVRGSDSE